MSKTPVLMPEPKNTMLGQATVYSSSYDPTLLQPIPRSLGRDAIGRNNFIGADVWGLYEVSWLNSKGLPVAAAGRLVVPASSPSIVESKSLKLYVGSFAQTHCASLEEVASRMREDIGRAVGEDVKVELWHLAEWPGDVERVPGLLLEAEYAGIEISAYEVDPDLLAADPAEHSEEMLSTNLFRSLCPVTGQPDHASITIRYAGPKIDHAGLLAYLVSYREHRGFHEQCVEQIFTDISERCRPEDLEVTGCFTRRGGIDISPRRTSRPEAEPRVVRTPRQ